MLKVAYDSFSNTYEASGYKKMPINKPLRDARDLLHRNLDCAVIEHLHYFEENVRKKTSYDTVRGVFWEVQDLYPNAGFKEKNHIQICVRNVACIKGYFIPRLS